jgi:hypothetical protein
VALPPSGENHEIHKNPGFEDEDEDENLYLLKPTQQHNNTTTQQNDHIAMIGRT